jgi:Tol biopolymer transport system component
MAITSGSRLGRFEVTSLLGAGGMGAVYRAHDPRLRRDVAIKVLPPAFSDDPERLRRFEQEALAVARLAHPNIVAVHDVGSHEGAPYVVMELLEGEPLRERIKGGALPVYLAVEYAIQIARGLAAAHDRDIVHRDIKPENLFVTRDGRIKILDFGIAKLTDASSAASASAVTLTGAPLGTPAYMSPEQARGTRADHRADLFSLGVVLYEMLAGVSPFRRETPAETMTAIIHSGPPEPAETPAWPPGLNRIVRRCLEKDPAARFQSASDLAFALETLAQNVAPAAARPASKHRYIPALLSAAALAAAAGGYLIGRSAGPIRSSEGVGAIHRLTDFDGLEEFPAIAPDFKSVAFSARVDGTGQIFVRLLAGGTPLQITKGSVDHEQPRWSRDASSVIYFSPAVPGDLQGSIWQVPALGGAPRRVVDSVGGGDVGPDGRIACFRLREGRVELVAASPDGAEVRAITRFAEPVYYRHPRWSPDGRWIAYQRGDGVRWDVFAAPVDGGAPRQLTHDNTQIHGLSWLPDGTAVIYSSSRGTTMPYLAALSLWKVQLEGGESLRVAAADLSYLHPDVHRSGGMVASRLRMRFDLWRYPIDGAAPEENVRRAVRITRQTGQVQTPTVGASDREIAFLSDSGGHANLWVTAPETGDLRQITYERDMSVALGVPIWSPDGNWIAFVSSRGNTGLAFGVWTVDPQGANLRNLAPRGFGFAWSPDARWLYYTDAGAVHKARVADGSAVRVRGGPARNVIGVHGRTLYFMVDRTLTGGSPGFEIHAAAPEDGPSRVLARIPASRAPQWQIINPALSPDGTSLAMPLTDGVTTNIWTVSTATGQWRQITEFGDRPTFIARRVSWSSDGGSIFAAVGEGDADVVLLEAGSSPQ